MTRVEEIMNRQVISVRPEMTLAEAVKLFTENHVGGAPVVDGRGKIVGMISELQMLEVVFDLDARKALVSDYMIEDFQSATPQDSLSHVAQLFAFFSFRGLPIVEKGRLVGIITRRSLMNYVLQTGELLSEPLVKFIPDLVQIV